MTTLSNCGGLGDLDMSDAVQTNRGTLRVCTCGNTMSESQEKCSQCFKSLNEAKDLLLD